MGNLGDGEILGTSLTILTNSILFFLAPVTLGTPFTFPHRVGDVHWFILFRQDKASPEASPLQVLQDFQDILFFIFITFPRSAGQATESCEE